MRVCKRHHIHIEKHKQFIDYIREMELEIKRSELVCRRFGDPIYIMDILGTEKQHKELCNRIFNIDSSEEYNLDRERSALWTSFFEV